jgi:hypothetical protein
MVWLVNKEVHHSAHYINKVDRKHQVIALKTNRDLAQMDLIRTLSIIKINYRTIRRPHLLTNLAKLFSKNLISRAKDTKLLKLRPRPTNITWKTEIRNYNTLVTTTSKTRNHVEISKDSIKSTTRKSLENIVDNTKKRMSKS